MSEKQETTERKPVYKRWWFYVVAAGLVLSIASLFI